MKNEPRSVRSLVACVDGDDASILRSGTAFRIVWPTMVDSFHVMIGAGCGAWGVCLFLNLPDAVMLHAELGRVLSELAERG